MREQMKVNTTQANMFEFEVEQIKKDIASVKTEQVQHY